MNKTSKKPKRQEVTKATFVKGTVLRNEDKNKLIKYLQQEGIEVYLKALGSNTDDTEFWEIRVDGIVP